MKSADTVVLTVEELEIIKEQAEKVGAARSGRFTLQEIQLVREQYAAQAARERSHREDLEWKIRLEVARIRDAELQARRAADDMRSVEESLERILSGIHEVKQPSVLVAVATPPIVARNPIGKPVAKAPLQPVLKKANGANGVNGSNGTTNGTNGAAKRAIA